MKKMPKTGKHDYTKIFMPQEGKSLHTNRNIFLSSILIVILFFSLMAYIVQFTIREAPAIITSPYNKRSTQLAEQIIRGSIISADGEILAQSGTEEDDEYSGRYYPYGRTFAHVVGYNTHGRSGLESICNFNLLTSHEELIEQMKNDVKGRKSVGDSVVTTLDTRVQRAAYEALEGYRGAAVAIEPKTGKVLALVSKPDFDPNSLDEDTWLDINTDEDNSCLLNRSTQGLYEPGSTYKILTALEYIIEKPGAYKKFSYNCKGETVIDSVHISCYEKTEHGKVDLTTAMAKSCNTAFVTLGSELNFRRFASLNDKFLFNKSIKFDLKINKSRFKLHGGSEKSEMPQTAIGQGKTLMTPFHNALIMCAVANDGTLMKPYLIDHYRTNDGADYDRTKAKKYARLMTKENAGILQKMLRKVVTDGTGYALDTDDYEVAGKTGSAENAGEYAHSWFTGYSGGSDPDLVVCVLVENVGAGSKYAAPIAREIFDAYYDSRDNDED